MAPIDWIFFDIGDVLFDEDAPHLLYYHCVFDALRRAGVDVTWDEFRSAIGMALRQTPNTAIPDAARMVAQSEELGDAAFHAGRVVYERIREPRPYGVLLDGVEPILRSLRRDFNLGIIANQHPPVGEALETYGIAPLFDVIGIDQVVGLSKPDVRFFQWGLEQAGTTGDRVIFVGDRADNDVAPAKSLGMKTVRFRRGIHYSHYDPRRTEEVADCEVRNLIDLDAAIRRLASG